MALDGGGIVEVLNHTTAEEQLVEQAHRESARTDGRVTNLNVLEALADVESQCRIATTKHSNIV